MDAQARTPPVTSETPGKRPPLEQIPGGRYHIVEQLSMGAIGAVYKALDTILDRPVAVKSVRLDTPFADHSTDELRERFVREARIAARLQHANIVTTHDIVATDTRGFIIMEFIEGQSLEALLKSQGRLPLSKAIRLLGQLGDALDYAHERNVVHRDVKPSNILVSSSLMNVWVTDFGIAKSELSTNLTMAGGVLGTPDYMSPEQAKGEDVDARSDLFSLGCILFECVTGEKPFRSPSLTGVLLSIINDEPVFPLNWSSLGLPTGLKPILHHALEKNKEKRYATGSALVVALESLRADEVSRADSIVKEAAAANPEARDTESKREEPAAANAEAGGPEAEIAEASDDVASEAGDEPTQDVAETKERDEVQRVAAVETPSIDEAAPETETPVAPASEAKTPVETTPDARAESRSESHEEVVAPSAAAGAPDRSSEKAPSAEETETVCEETLPIDAASEREPDEPTAPELPPLDPERLEALKTDGRPLRLSPTLSADLQGVEISPEEGFVLSRVDGVSRACEILALSPMAEADSVRALFLLLDKELIHFGGAALETPRPKPRLKEAPPATPKGPDEALVGELERLLELAERDAWAELLGVATDAPQSARKSGYLRIIAKYHPDKHSWARNNGFQEKLSRLCAAAAQAVEELASANPTSSKAQSEGASSKGGAAVPVGSTAESTASFDRRRYARELHDRALRAYDLQDFWDAIQLSRQAIEVDDGQSQFHCLLGRALLQNKKWRKEAADAFRTASDLDPMNVLYLGMLGAIYRAEGLSARAESILKRAREIDADYELPGLEADAEAKIETG